MILTLQIVVETGHMGRQASGAVTVTDGETVSWLQLLILTLPQLCTGWFYCEILA